MPENMLVRKKETALFLIDSYNDLGYQVYNVGGNDLAAGLQFVKKAEKIAKFNFISANITDSTNSQLLFKPYKIIKSGNKKFGIIGITSKPKYNVSGVKITEPLYALNKYLSELKKRSDYIIVLAAINNIDETKIINSKTSIDFLLCASTYRFSKTLDFANSMYIARCGNIGKYIGVISMNIIKEGLPLENVSKINNQLSYTEKRLKSYAKDMGDKTYDEYYADRPSILNVIHSLQRHEKELKKQKGKIINALDYELVRLDNKIKDDPYMWKKVNEHKAVLRRMGIKTKSIK